MFHSHVIKTVLNNSWGIISQYVKCFITSHRKDSQAFLDNKVIDGIQIEIQPIGKEHYEIAMVFTFERNVANEKRYSISITMDKAAMPTTIVKLISQILELFDTEQMMVNWSDGLSTYNYRSVEFENDWSDARHNPVPFPANNLFVKGVTLKITPNCFDYRLIKEVRCAYYIGGFND